MTNLLGADQRVQVLQRASELSLRLDGGKVRRTSSRFCLGVEHGDYNGTELFGVGTDRFVWLSFLPNHSGRIRIFSEAFPADGLVDLSVRDTTDESQRRALSDRWERFPRGVVEILRKEGYPIEVGFDAVICANIPGGGMSRSASLTLNLILTLFEVNSIDVPDGMTVVRLAQLVENDFIGSPCGLLDQVMIYFARAGQGTHFNPTTEEISHVPFGGDAEAFRLVSLDTGTKRPGLEKSTYRVRREECDEVARLVQETLGHTSNAGIREARELAEMKETLGGGRAPLYRRLKYIFEAQNRFKESLGAWRLGEIERVGACFRADGIGLRDDYEISGPELETMCDIARTVPGVYGERMLGGGDKGASGAIVSTGSVELLRARVKEAYPLSHPERSRDYAVHECRMVDGVAVGEL